MDRNERDPRVQFVRKIDQVLRVVEQRLYQHPEETDQDRHLDYQRTEASYRVDSAFPIQAHRFLGYALPVSGVPFLDIPDLWLQPGHGSHLAQLPDGQRDRDHPHQYGEDYDGQPHLGKGQDIQHQQGVEHRPDDDLSPEVAEYG